MDRVPDMPAANSPSGGLEESGRSGFPRPLWGMEENESRQRSAQTMPALVLDPFAGSGTLEIVARRLGLRCVSLDLSPDYARLALARARDAEKTDADREREGYEEAGQMRMVL